MRKRILMLILLGILALSVSCKPGIKPKGGDLPLSTSDELKKFNSVQELAEFLKQSQESNYPLFGGVFRSATSVQMMEATAAQAAAKISATDYSQTNVQVAGVDEADFVKNDDKYIYILAGDSLVIIEAFPPEDADIVSETKLKGNPTQLFVNGDRLVVFYTTYEDVVGFYDYDFIPRPRSTTLTHAVVFDISNRAKPKKLFDYSLRGYYFQARMIGDYVYFIVNEGAYYHPLYIDTPVVKESDKVIIRPEIYYFDNPETSYNFNTIASFNIKSEERDIKAKSFLLGYTNVLYVSENNIYISYQKNLPYRYYTSSSEERFYAVVFPLLPSSTREEINRIKGDDSIPSAEKWGRISEAMENMYNSMDEDEKQELITQIEKAIEEYELRQEAERSKSVIHRIEIRDGSIKYGARGEVHGTLLNQFSMDEYDSHLRVATTSYLWGRRGSAMFNNVYVLNEDMKVVGKLEGLAEDERIYAARFIGDRLYLVTFKNIDPLFVIDLSDPENPDVLGKLKIPGYSDYLHPYDENHIIGIGKETEMNEWGGVSTAGVKLALFDVSDVSKPKQIDKYEIGDPGSDSEALRDHKAFLFSKEKDILVIPVREVKGRRSYEEGYGWRQNIWQGAYIFSVSPEKGFRVKGKVSHSDEKEYSYGYWDSPNAVRRSLYMDNVLYTISSRQVKLTSLEDFEELGSVRLPLYSYPMRAVPVPMVGGVGSEEVVIEKV